MLVVRLALPQNLFYALRVLFARQATGELRMVADGVAMTVDIVQGRPVFATGGETLGRNLLRHKKLTVVEYVTLANETEGAAVHDADRAFGEAAARRGWLTLDEVRVALETLVRERLTHCLNHPDSRPEFTERAVSATKLVDDTFAERLFVLAAESMAAHHVERVLELHATRYPRLIESRDTIAQSLSLSAAEMRFVSLVDGSCSVHELVEGRLVDGFTPAAVMVTLLMSGLAELLPYPPSARKSTTIVPPRSSQRPARGSVPPAPRASMRHASAGAYSFASTPPSRPPLEDAMQEPNVAARAALADGKRYLDRCEFSAAASELERAVTLVPESHAYKTYALWAAFRARGDATATGQRLALKRAARKALEENEHFAFGKYVLAHLARLEGRESAARELFSDAWSLAQPLTDLYTPPRFDESDVPSRPPVSGIVPRTNGLPSSPPPRAQRLFPLGRLRANSR